MSIAPHRGICMHCGHDHDADILWPVPIPKVPDADSVDRSLKVAEIVASDSSAPKLIPRNELTDLAKNIFADGMNRIAAMWPCSPGTVEKIRNETLDRLDAAMKVDL